MNYSKKNYLYQYKTFYLGMLHAELKLLTFSINHLKFPL